MAKNTNYFFKLDLLILSILKRRDMYGYEITKYISEITHEKIIPKQGTMYPIIYQLLNEEYVTSYNEIVNNKIRVYYHLEDKGIEYLNKITQEYDELVECINLIVHGKEDNESI